VGRRRTYFETREKAEAEKTAKEIEAANFGIQAASLTASERIMALDAITKLKPFGVTLTTVVNEYVERRKACTASVAEAVEKFMATRRQLGRSATHLANLKAIFARFTAKHGADHISDVTADQIEAFIYAQPGSPRTLNHHRTKLHSLFEFARRRRLARENPVKDIEPQQVKSTKVGILTVEQMRRLLVATKADPDIFATVALGGFAGLRPEEIARLSWSAIDLENCQIDCGAEITKGAAHRFVRIEPNLLAWIQPVVVEALRQGQVKIHRSNFWRRFNRVRRAAGFDLRGNGAPEEVQPDEQLVPWPHDGLRHSFGSYHLAHFKDAARTALEMGHRSTAMLFEHYRARVPDKAAAEWFAILPQKERKARNE
jgi:integrase